jgi:hypothetical protein
MTIGGVTVADEMVGCVVPRESFGDLARDPPCRWIGRDTARHQPPALVPEDDQDEQQPEADRRHDQKVHGGNASRMVCRKVFQVCDGPRPLLAMYLATVDCAISIPSFISSPWMRGAPHSGLARLMSRIRRRICAVADETSPLASV